MADVIFAIEAYTGPDGRTGFVIFENGQRRDRLFRTRDEAEVELTRLRQVEVEARAQRAAQAAARAHQFSR